jgi:hypothetical protein
MLDFDLAAVEEHFGVLHAIHGGEGFLNLGDARGAGQFFAA